MTTAVPSSNRARTVGVGTNFQNLRPIGTGILPQSIAVLAEPEWAKINAGDPLPVKQQVFSSNEAATIYGFGSPIHLMVRELLPDNGQGVGSIPIFIYPMTQLKAGGNPLEQDPGLISPTGTQTSDGTIRVNVGGIYTPELSIPSGTSIAVAVDTIVAAVNAISEMPAVAVDAATDVELTPKWAGKSADRMGITVEIIEDGGFSFGTSDPPAGDQDLDVLTPLGQMNETWHTLVVFSGFVDDTSEIDDISDFNESERWNPIVSKPFVCVMGQNKAQIPASGSDTDLPALLSNRTVCQVVNPGSVNADLQIAAAHAARIAIVANENPARDYGSQQMLSLYPGPDSVQWDYTERDTALKRGSSSIKVKANIVEIADTVTTYHPDGETDPAYRFVKDIMKVMQVQYLLQQEFEQEKWDGAPLIPDNQSTSNPDAKRPKDAKAAIASIIDALGLAAVISDPETAKDSIVVEIDGTNPNRLNITFLVQLSGNTNIISIDFNWGFFFGSP